MRRWKVEDVVFGSFPRFAFPPTPPDSHPINSESLYTNATKQGRDENGKSARSQLFVNEWSERRKKKKNQRANIWRGIFSGVAYLISVRGDLSVWFDMKNVAVVCCVHDIQQVLETFSAVLPSFFEDGFRRQFPEHQQVCKESTQCFTTYNSQSYTN